MARALVFRHKGLIKDRQLSVLYYSEFGVAISGGMLTPDRDRLLKRKLNNRLTFSGSHHAVISQSFPIIPNHSQQASYIYADAGQMPFFRTLCVN
jgi:hypothetical protein